MSMRCPHCEKEISPASLKGNYLYVTGCMFWVLVITLVAYVATGLVTCCNT